MLTSANFTKHRIITENVPPIAKRPYKIPFHQREIVRKEIDGLLDEGRIRHSESPWSAPVEIVNKKSSNGEDKI